ncbi:SDR family NAD(P)-dependent oxidoreductase [[Mycobacterium] burgundiense]|uniref:3-oxoacyl-[acyl-carrier-protein] reductase MabA n=1 Tax=[Mycobacterium] burgundiense TaxID=3064286 RepID=A0ABM9L9V5_9MYCO|nr:SDR family NAD(P)-dependent oxidoreductase [Mycolicibacterium sp. MU0053]CAJ1495349.1 SDR family NAD(P)-dependent oxidoreductase [Mycolicibacterium sp. MU0053]
MTRLSKLSRSVAGQVIVVTGAASGMGLATARLLADEGALVGLVDRAEEPLTAAADELLGAGARAHAVAVDVATPGAPASAIAAIRAELGPIDALVNNAAIATGTGIDDEDFEAHWAASLAVNLTAYAAFIRAALADLRRLRAGRIVNVASTEALGATARQLPYTVSKHGVVGLTRSLAVELGAAGVTVNCICPGPINTGMTAPIPDEAKAEFARRRTALRRYGDPEEVAHATLSLLLPAASYITGAVLAVDGGLTVRNA